MSRCYMNLSGAHIRLLNTQSLPQPVTDATYEKKSVFSEGFVFALRDVPFCFPGKTSNKNYLLMDFNF